jgi:hypothetical protein
MSCHTLISDIANIADILEYVLPTLLFLPDLAIKFSRYKRETAYDIH